MSTTTNVVDILKGRYYIMPTYVYMIRRKSDGFFSSGGAYPKFSSTGKIWRNLQTLHNHLALFRTCSVYDRELGHRRTDYINGIWSLPEVYKNCEVIKLEINYVKATDLPSYCRDLKPNASWA